MYDNAEQEFPKGWEAHTAKPHVLVVWVLLHFYHITLLVSSNLFGIQFQDSKTRHCPCAQVIKAEGTLKSQSVIKKHNSHLKLMVKKKLCISNLPLSYSDRRKLCFLTRQGWVIVQCPLPKRPFQQALLLKWSMLIYFVTLHVCQP